MIQTEHLSPGDLAAAGAVVEAAFGRPGMAERMRLYYKLQPQNWFCARRDGQIVAAVGAYGYRDAASVGMMGVSPGAQRQGIGLLLMTHLVAHLESAGYAQIFLEASPAGVHLYPKLGFVCTGDTLRMARPASPARSGNFSPQLATPPLPMSVNDLPAVTAYDESVFGRRRPEILAALYARDPGRAFLCRDASGHLSGYLMADTGTLGPWASDTPPVAAALLAVALNLSYANGPRATFPAENAAAADLLASAGFVPMEKLSHLYRGAPGDPRDRLRYYGQATLMLG